MLTLLDKSAPATGRAIVMAEQFLSRHGEYAFVGARQARHSWVAYFARRHERPLYCLKVRGTEDTAHPGRENTSALEYEALSWIHRHFSRVEPFQQSVPRPVAHFSECRGILMECVSGRSLTHGLLWRGNLLSAPWSTRYLRSLFRTSGAWLRVFHDADRPEWLADRTPPMEVLLSRAHTAIALSQDIVLREMPLERLMGSVRSSFNGERHAVVSHGDYHPNNILFSDGEIRVVDLTTVAMASAEDDLASFLVRAASPKHRVVGGQLAGTAALWGGLAATFLAGYGYDARNAKSQLTPFLVVHFLEHLASISYTVADLPAPLRMLLLPRISLWAKGFASSLLQGTTF